MLKRVRKKTKRKIKDDSLYGLLLSYKMYNTYIKVLISETENKIFVILASNPKFWDNVSIDQIDLYRELRRLELHIEKKSVKYILPKHILTFLGSDMGLKLPQKSFVVHNELENFGYYAIETSIKNKKKVILGIKKILNLKPQKKYELLEKSLESDTAEDK